MSKYFFSLVLFAALILSGASGATAAPMFTIGVEAWNTQLSGNVYNPQQPDLSRILMRQDLGMGRHWNPNFIFAFALPGYLPNMEFEYGTMLSNGSNSGHAKICWNGVVYDANGRLISQAAIKQGRILFYWNPVDNSIVKFRAGLDFRWVSLNLSTTGTVTGNPSGLCPVPITPPDSITPTTSATMPASDTNPTQTFQESTSAGVVSWLPGLNLGVTIHLPAHFDLFLRGSGLTYAASYLYDFRLGFNYHLGAGLTLAAGYRRWRLHIDKDSLSVNGTLDFKGPYAGLYWSF